MLWYGFLSEDDHAGLDLYGAEIPTRSARLSALVLLPPYRIINHLV